MKYENGKNIFPEELLKQIQNMLPEKLFIFHRAIKSENGENHLDINNT